MEVAHTYLVLGWHFYIYNVIEHLEDIIDYGIYQLSFAIKNKRK